jgi:hypothetical protein
VLSESDTALTLRSLDFQPKRMAKLGPPINRHNSAESAHNYERSARSHHKYKGSVEMWRKLRSADKKDGKDGKDGKDERKRTRGKVEEH